MNDEISREWRPTFRMKIKLIVIETLLQINGRFVVIHFPDLIRLVAIQWTRVQTRWQFCIIKWRSIWLCKVFVQKCRTHLIRNFILIGRRGQHVWRQSIDRNWFKVVFEVKTKFVKRFVLFLRSVESWGQDLPLVVLMAENRSLFSSITSCKLLNCSSICASIMLFAINLLEENRIKWQNQEI